VELRWVALLALWTLISGPIFGVYFPTSPLKKVAVSKMKAKP
jgi:hypothetical protein